MSRTALIVCILLALSGCAREPSPQDVAARVSSRIMSPFCPGVTLHDCPSRHADKLRLKIERWAQAGRSEGQILAALEAEYGAGIRAVPPAEGAGLLAWIMPALALSGGAGLGWLLLRRWTRPSSPATEHAPATPEERSRLEAELTRLREET